MFLQKKILIIIIISMYYVQMKNFNFILHVHIFNVFFN